MLKNEVIKAERRVLRELGFCVHVKHPHKLITTYLKMLDSEGNTAVVRRAWNYMNDSLRTDIFLRYVPETIACACIYLAARDHQMPLPDNWWELYDATQTAVEEICLTILRLYAIPRPSWSRLEAKIGLLKKKQEEYLKAKQEPANGGGGGGGETPNPSAAERFSPAASRQGSPKSEAKPAKTKRESREDDAKDRRKRKHSKENKRRGRSSSTRSRSRSRSRGAETESGSAESRTPPKRTKSKKYLVDHTGDVRKRSEVRVHKAKKEKRERRSRSRSADKEKARRREREVRRTLGKRRSRSPPFAQQPPPSSHREKLKRR